ncbi:hypothetical protein [Helicobacter sp. 13S00401-1]|uniref:hypothetical protein n=1 Tax=Helicobacter sp. 13S00401-1 TaxID=1905758 RepID=UPI0015528F74|nr:hypothetical protein [Helicobacter sp. 13S00401-1]
MKKDDDVNFTRTLLINVSEGEITNEFLDALPFDEFQKLEKEMGAYLGINPKD